MSHRTTVALVGIAGYGDAYLAPLLQHADSGRYEIVGLVDRAPQRSQRLAEVAARSIPVYTDLADLLAEGAPDLVMMATPIYLHAPHTIMALNAGSNVLCEKPAAATLADARRMCAAQAQAAGRFAAIGYQWSFSRAIRRLKRDVLAGRFGRPLRFRSLVLFPRGLAYYDRNQWAGRLATDAGELVFDSPVNNAAAHYLHNMLYVLGEQDGASATPIHLRAELYRANAIESYDTAVLRMMAPCGAEVLFATSHATPRRVGPRFRFEFEHAVVTYGEETPNNEVIVHLAHGDVLSYGRPEADRDEKLWQCISAAARGDDTVACDVRAALPHAMCVAAAAVSAGEPITIPRERTRRHRLDGEEEMVVAVELEDVLHQCYRSGALPSELGTVGWAGPGALIQLRDLAEYAEASAEPVVETLTDAGALTLDAAAS